MTATMLRRLLCGKPEDDEGEDEGVRRLQRKPYVCAMVFAVEKEPGDDELGEYKPGLLARICGAAYQDQDAHDQGEKQAKQRDERDAKRQECEAYRERVAIKLEALGLRLYKTQNKNGSLIFLLVGADQAVLEYQAEMHQMPVELLPSGRIQKFMRDATLHSNSGPGSQLGLVTASAPFVADERPGDGKLKINFRSARGSSRFEFQTAIKGRVLQTVIQASESLGGAGINMVDLNRAEGMHAAFQVHDANLLKLMADWADLRRIIGRGHLKTHRTSGWVGWSQPLNRLREYFGETPAMYFAFSGFVSKGLLYLSAWSVLLSVLIGVTRIDSTTIVACGGVMAVFAVTLPTRWAGEQNRLEIEWNMQHFESRLRGAAGTNETQRCTSQLKVIFDMLVVMAIAVGLAAFSCWAVTSLGNPWVIGLVIQVLNRLISVVGRAMTEWEGHPDQAAFDGMLVLKVALLQSVASYTGLFYIAFAKSSPQFKRALGMENTTDHDCPLMSTEHPFGHTELEPSCITELATTLPVVFCVHVAVWILELIAPLVVKAVADARQKPASDRPPLQAEAEAAMPRSDGVVFAGYNNLALQFGWVAFFGAAWPLAGAVAACSAAVQIRLHAKGFCTLYQRPAPQGCRGIGAWQWVFVTMGCLAVLSNGGLVFFSSNIFTACKACPTGWERPMDSNALVGSESGSSGEPPVDISIPGDSSTGPVAVPFSVTSTYALLMFLAAEHVILLATCFAMALAKAPRVVKQQVLACEQDFDAVASRGRWDKVRLKMRQVQSKIDHERLELEDGGSDEYPTVDQQIDVRMQ